MSKLKMLMKPEWLCVVVLFLSLWGTLSFHPRIENVRLFQGMDAQEGSLPVLKKMEKGERFSVEFDVESRFENYDLAIIPDDCAEEVVINGHVVDLRHFKDNCNFSRGFVLRDSLLALYRVGNRTHYAFSMRNEGGDAGLNAQVSQTSPLRVSIGLLAVLSLGLLCFFIARRFGFGWGIAVIVFLAVVIRAVFLMNVPYTNFAYDVDGHVAYVQYIIENHSVPGTDDCWTCYHPPVYYVSAVPSYLFGEWLGLSGPIGLRQERTDIEEQEVPRAVLDKHRIVVTACIADDIPTEYADKDDHAGNNQEREGRPFQTAQATQEPRDRLHKDCHPDEAERHDRRRLCPVGDSGRNHRRKHVLAHARLDVTDTAPQRDDVHRVEQDVVA